MEYKKECTHNRKFANGLDFFLSNLEQESANIICCWEGDLEATQNKHHGLE
jgi:hypothetical protein